MLCDGHRDGADAKWRSGHPIGIVHMRCWGNKREADKLRTLIECVQGVVQA